MHFKKFGAFISILLLAGCAGEIPTLGVATGKLMQCPDKPNCVNSQETNEEHSIAPIVGYNTQADTKQQLIDILNNTSNAEIKEVKDDFIRAEFVSKIFRFVDDVEFYFPKTDSQEVIIHVRSASRVGHSDLGVNRDRIEEIRSQM